MANVTRAIHSNGIIACVCILIHFLPPFVHRRLSGVTSAVKWLANEKLFLTIDHIFDDATEELALPLIYTSDVPGRKHSPSTTVF